MVHKYKKLAVTGVKTDKVVNTQNKLKTLLSQLDQAYEEQFTQVMEAELVTIDGETTVMAQNLSAQGLYDPEAAARRKKPSSLKAPWFSGSRKPPTASMPIRTGPSRRLHRNCAIKSTKSA